MASPAPFNGFDFDGVYLASVLMCCADNSDEANAKKAIEAYAPAVVTFFPQQTPYPQAFLIVTNYDVIVVFAGTQNTVEWVYDVLGSAQSSFAGVPGQVSQWFYGAASQAQSNMGASIVQVAPGRKVTYIGHSLGGAIAQILYQLLLGQISSPCQVYTFGCPRVGDPVFAAAFGINKLFRIENVDDPIPSLPPTLWASATGHYPFPGFPPFATYTNGGLVKTLTYQGYLVDGQTPTATQAIVNALQGTQPYVAHQSGEYVRRLALQLPVFEEGGAGADFEVTTAATDTILDPPAWETGPMAAPQQYAFPAANKVEVFYKFQGQGFSEIFYSDQPPDQLVTTGIPAYVNARLALATAGCQAMYARVSVIGAPRQIRFWVPGYTIVNGANIKGGGPAGTLSAVVPTSYNGSYSGADVQPQQALLVRLLINGKFWTRMFLHAFPPEVITPGFYAPTPAWIQAFNKFGKWLMQAGATWVGVGVNPNTAPGRIYISQLTAAPSRGATILYTPPAPGSGIIPPIVGQPVQVGGAGAEEVGMNGRKIVVSLIAAGTNPPTNPGIVVGGVSPVGAGPQPGQAYFYPVTFQKGNVQQAIVERLTTHKVGKIVFEAAGRRRLAIPLRR